MNSRCHRQKILTTICVTDIMYLTSTPRSTSTPYSTRQPHNMHSEDNSSKLFMVGIPSLRTDGDSTITNSRDDYESFSVKIRNEMKRVQADVGHTITTAPPPVERIGSIHLPTSNLSVRSEFSGSNDQRSIQSQRLSLGSCECPQQTMKRLEDEVVNERRRDEEYKHIKKQNKLLQQTLSSKDAEIAQLKQQLQSTNLDISSNKKHISRQYTKELNHIEQEYNDELVQCSRDNKKLQTELRKMKQTVNMIQDQTNEINILQNENTNLKRMLQVAEQDVELAQQAAIDIEIKNDKTLHESMRMETLYADMKENYDNLMEDKIQFERDNAALINELNGVIDERDVLNSRLKMLDQLSDELESTNAEKNSAIMRYQKLHASHASLEMEVRSTRGVLKRALAEKERALALCNELDMEHNRLQGAASQEESLMTEMISKQRDKMGLMMERYMEDIGELKNANIDILRERDELKEELISVLETASCQY